MGYTNIHEHKRYYYTLIIRTILSIQNTTQIFPLNHNVRFLPCRRKGSLA